MRIAFVRETFPGERRVSIVPAHVPALIKLGAEVIMESQAGAAAGYPDQEYQEKGVQIAATRNEAMQADVLLQVRCLGANASHFDQEMSQYREGQIVVGSCDPLGAPQSIADFAKCGATLFALELIPRITRAQSMDVLSSMATISGYRAVLLAAVELPKMFPMLMTAAGTITAARVFVIGAGVAGLQAIATAKRLGAVVQAYDVRVACREQCESLGAKFVEVPVDTAGAEDKGGYAKALSEEFYVRQRAVMAAVAKQSDVIITTAAIPGRKSPVLITEEAVRGMAPGSVIVDLAAERGGNCVLSKPEQRVVEHGVTILGPTNLPAEVPYHASQMYSNNLLKFLQNLIKNGAVSIRTEDEIIRETLAVRDKQVRQPKLREILGLPPLEVVNQLSETLPLTP